MDSEVIRKQREKMIDYFISNQDWQPSVLLQLARMFKCKAKLLEEKNSGGSHVRALEARLKAESLAVLPLLEESDNDQSSGSSSIELYEFLRKSLDKVELTDAIEEDVATKDLVTNKLSDLTSEKIQSSGFSFQHGKGARSNLENTNSAAQQVVHAIESLKQENRKNRQELISKLDELIKVTIAKDEKQRAQSSVDTPFTEGGSPSNFKNQEVPLKESTGINFNLPWKPNVKADPSLLYIFGSNKTKMPGSDFGSVPLSGGKSEETGLENLKICTRSIPATTTTSLSSTSNFGSGFSGEPMFRGASTTTTTTASGIFGTQPAVTTTSSIFCAQPTATPSTANIFGTGKPMFDGGDSKPVFGGEANPLAANICGTTKPNFGLLAAQANNPPAATPLFAPKGFGAPAVTTTAAAPATTTTTSSSLFGDTANQFASKLSFIQSTAPTTVVFGSTASIPTAIIFGAKTATTAPLTAAALKDAGKKDGSVSFLPTKNSLSFSTSAANTVEQQPAFKKDPNFTFEGAGASVFGAKAASKTPTKPSTTTTNVFRAKDDSGWTVLHSACADGNLDFVKFLVEKGADVNAKNESNETVLHYSCALDKMDIVAFLVEKGADINVKGYKGETALHYAARNKKWDIVKFLVDKGADVQAKDDDGRTVLEYAVKSRETNIIEFLVDKGADVRAKNNDGETALYLIAQYSFCYSEVSGIIKLLVEKGADVNATNNLGRTALHYLSMMSGRLETVKCLVENGANVHVKQYDGETALHIASRNGFFNNVEFLVDNGADVNAEDQVGTTPLHCASQSGNLDTVKFLIESGADVGVKNKDGQTALDFARKEGNLNIVWYIIEKGCRS